MLPALMSLAFAVNEFVGASQCGACHAAQFNRQSRSHHAAALASILKTALAKKLIGHTVREKNGIVFDYAPASGGILVTATGGGAHSSAVLEWAFGAGAQGITAVGRIGNRYFEHRVSWYTREGRAGLTIGHPAEPPAGAAALGQEQSAETIYRCFHCHATGVQGGPDAKAGLDAKAGPDLSGMRAGVECERCHGPGRLHAAHPSAASIANPGRLSPQALVEMCGECHRLPPPGARSSQPERASPESIRFAPIGLMASRCFQLSGKLSCLTCHDPHSDARRDAPFYVEKCLGCHTVAPADESKCRRAAREDCLPCHMPKSSPLPFLEFTDHRIGVLKTSAQSGGTEAYQRASVEAQPRASAEAHQRDSVETLPRASVESSQRAAIDAHLRASRKYDEAGDPARAVAEAQAAIELEPRNLAARIQLGQIFLSHNTPAPAVEIFSDALEIAPDSLLAHLGRGLALKDLERFADAEKELTACLNRDPSMAVAFDALGAMYLQISESAKLAALSKQYIQANPSDYRGYYYLAAANEHEKEDSSAAEEAVRRSLQLNPNFAASHALLGKLLTQGTQANRLEEAVHELERAIQLRPDYPPAHLYLGNAYRKFGRSTDAAREFQALRNLNETQQSRPSLVYHRGGEKK